MSHPYRIVIVGRPNVGKSTLFNRLLGRRRSLVHNEPGVTRDRIEEPAEWWVKGKAFPALLVDTGGLGGERFADEIQRQVQIALSEVDVVLFLFDSQSGLTPLDEELMRELRQSGVGERAPILGIVNKVDDEAHEARGMDFYSMGLDSILTLSAEHGRGINDLQEAIAEVVGFFEETPESTSESGSDLEVEAGEPEPVEGTEASESEFEPETAPRIPKVAIVGRPNVGKSTLLNAFLGQNRMITSPIAGTTIDTVEVTAEVSGKPFLLMDTAGIRRKSKTEQGIEVLSIVQTRKALEKADIALLVLDGEKGITDQDEKIGGLIEEVGCSVVLLINKWDTQERNREFSSDDAAERIRSEMAFLRYAPIVFVSALKKKGLDHLGELFEEIMEQRRVKVSTHEFTEWIREETKTHNPANAKFYLCHQTGRRPPTFVCHVNDPEKVHFSLKRRLLNLLRERWGYMGTPVRLLFIEGKNRRSLPKKRRPAGKVGLPRSK